jgi:predicted CXXCH cytochrome family protein
MGMTPSLFSRPAPLSAQPRYRGAAAALVFLLSFPAAGPVRAGVTLYYPPDQIIVESDDLVVEGRVTGEEIDEVEVFLNGESDSSLPVSDFNFSGMVELKEGLNAIAVGGIFRSVFLAGGDEVAPGGYAPIYGHFNLGDGCEECHDSDDSGRLFFEVDPDDACRWCHNELLKGSREAPVQSLHKPVENGSCLACHEPHLSRKKNLLIDRAPECKACHEELYAKLKSDRFVHGPLSMGDCRLCHTIHSSREDSLLSQAKEALCVGCHSELSTPADTPPEKRPHPMIPEGECANCHDPHSSQNELLMRRVGTRLCLGCHPGKTKSFHEKKGFSIFMCSKCHDLHHPSRAHLIVDNSRFLCLECHTFDESAAFTHQSVKEGACFLCHTFHSAPLSADISTTCLQCHGTNKDLPAIHGGLPLEKTWCTSCHLPHQSNQEKLLQPVQHTPFRERDCDACHRERSTLIGKTYRPLCLSCHRRLDISGENRPADEIHPPFLERDCGRCHASHSSREPFQLKSGEMVLCLECHRKFKRYTVMKPKSAHAGVLEGRCDTCHDAHFSGNTPLLKKPRKELCHSCHESILKGPGGKRWLSVHQPVEKGQCQGCHQPHTGRKAHLLKVDSPGLCEPCHGELFSRIASPESVSKHRPVEEGGCDTCHLTHGSDRFALTKSGGEGGLCRGCHENLPAGHRHFSRGPEDGSGNPEGCTLCHDPHAAERSSLLRERGELSSACTRCHTRSPALSQAHGQIGLSPSGCLKCHDPHTSDRPSFLLPVQHAPFSRGACGDCHRGRTVPEAPLRALCLSCHKDLGGKEARTHVHPPFREDCSICHASHGSSEAALLKADRGPLCTSCHDAIGGALASGPESAHRAAAENRCPACHEPHYSDHPALLRTDPAQVCQSCHEETGKNQAGTAWSVGHPPVAEGRCRECHQPHSSEAPYLLKGRMPSLCLTCHSDLITAEEAASAQSQHRDFEEGSCQACHHVHGSDTGALLKPGSGGVICLDCHPAARTKHHTFGRAEIIAALEGKTVGPNLCLLCHDPHFSRNARLLRDRQGTACRACHQ